MNLFAQKSQQIAGRPVMQYLVRTKIFSQGVGNGCIQHTLSKDNTSRSASSSSSSSFQLPEATWSLKDLELSKQHEPISDTELQKLAKRALLDLDSLHNDNTEKGRTASRKQLRQDLGNMMHMIEQVQSFDFDNTSRKDMAFSEADIYDKPRGVVAAPLRRDDVDDKGDNDNNDDEKESAKRKEEEEKQTSRRVFENFLRPRENNYFSIETKREDVK